MNHIQTDVSDEALVTAIRANLCDFFRYLGKSTPETYHQAGTFARWHTPLAIPLMVSENNSPIDRGSHIRGSTAC